MDLIQRELIKETIESLLLGSGMSLYGETACMWLHDDYDYINTIFTKHRSYYKCRRIIKKLAKRFKHVHVVNEGHNNWECSIYPEGSIPFYVHVATRLPPKSKCTLDIDRLEVSHSIIKLNDVYPINIINKVFTSIHPMILAPSGAALMRANHLMASGWKMHEVDSVWVVEDCSVSKCGDVCCMVCNNKVKCGERYVVIHGGVCAHYLCFIVAHGI
jgi:hypothetical protein